ncbi:hypothetical protein DMUE_0249 [Dictyocoela muelleri]|nr:hypothetical protein DMUE_0249 [Dictyocoela muelleri]
MTKCNICNENANVKFRNIKYCNSCFKNKIKQRVKKSLPMNLYNKKIGILFSGSLKSVMLLSILNEIIKNKNVDILIVNDEPDKIIINHELINKIDDRENENIESKENNNILVDNIYHVDKNFNDYDKYDFIFNENSIDDQAMEVIKNFLSGEKINFLSKTTILPLGNLNDEEIVYYWFLDGKKEYKYNEVSNFSKKIKFFVNVLNRKNYSTCQNILSVTSKIRENQNFRNKD